MSFFFKILKYFRIWTICFLLVFVKISDIFSIRFLSNKSHKWLNKTIISISFNFLVFLRFRMGFWILGFLNFLLLYLESCLSFFIFVFLLVITTFPLNISDSFSLSPFFQFSRSLLKLLTSFLMEFMLGKKVALKVFSY